MNHLFSKTAERILRVVLASPLKEFREIELIQAAGTGKGAGAQYIEELKKEWILSIRKVGKAKTISLRLNSPRAFFLKNLFDQKKLSLLPTDKLAAIHSFRREVYPSVSLIIIFGSTVAGTAAKDSDIDLLITSTDLSAVELARKKTEHLFGIRLNLHPYIESEIKELAGKDTFIQNVFLQGIVLFGLDLAKEVYSSFSKKSKEQKQRLLFFKERITAAERNYLQNDKDSALAILPPLQEQIIFYLLSKKEIAYQSKKDAAKAIKSLPEGKLFANLAKSSLKQKIDKLGAFVQKLLEKEILEEEGYGDKRRNN